MRKQLLLLSIDFDLEEGKEALLNIGNQRKF